MLVTVSPAKKLDWDTQAGRPLTRPQLSDDANYLARVARDLSEANLRKLMGISENLARLNRERFAAFSDDPDPETTRAAVFAFAGDTYQGLEAKTLDDDALDWARGHLRILSGLYGLLRPFDAIQPYRLEMGSRLKTRAGGNLYAYWGSRIAEALNRDIAETGTRALINCASTEYFTAVDTAALTVPVITPVFLEERGGEAKIVSFYAKRARGAMARFVMERRIDDPAELRHFNTGGYRFSPARSTADAPVFLRQAEAAEAA